MGSEGIDGILGIPENYGELSREQLLEIIKSLAEHNQRLEDERKKLVPYLGEQGLEYILTGKHADILRVTSLFLDIEGFTAFSDELDRGKGDAEKLLQAINPIYQIAVDIFQSKYSAHINKYIGDAVLVTFGAPGYTPNQCEAAVRAALEFQARLDSYCAEHGLSLKARIGLNTGYVISGVIGAEDRKQIDVIGNNVNISQRIEDHVKSAETRTGILVDEETYLATKEMFEFVSHGSFIPKGKAEQIRVFEPLNIIPKKTQIMQNLSGRKINLYEREHEFSQLSALKDAVKHGISSAVTIVGETGTGKTELVRQALLSDDSYCILSESCSPLEQTTSFSTAARLAKQILGIKETEVRENLAALGLDDAYLPIYGALIGMSFGSFVNYSPEELMAQAQDFFAELVIRKSRETGLILHIDDIDNIDKSSSEALELLLSRASADRYDGNKSTEKILFAFTSQAQIYPGSQAINISHLRESSSIISLLKDIIGENAFVHIAPVNLQSICRVTCGDPVFIHEIAAEIRKEYTAFESAQSSTAVISRKDYNNRIDAILTRYESTQKSDLPDKIADAIVERAKRLGEWAVYTLQLLSVSGKYGFESDLKQQLNFEPDYELLKREGFLLPDAANLEFTHDKLRRAFYQSIGPQRRKELHRNLARIIEQAHTIKNSDEQSSNVDFKVAHKIAYHYSLSDYPERAIPYYELAAKRSAALFGNDDVIAHYARINEIISAALPDDSIEKSLNGRTEATFKQANTRTAIGSLDSAIHDYSYVISAESKTQQRSNHRLMRAYNGRGNAFIRKGDYGAAEADLETAKSIAVSHNLPYLANILINIGVLYSKKEESARVNKGAFLPSQPPINSADLLDNAEKAYLSALELAKEHDIKHLEAIVYENMAFICMKQGNIAQALEFSQQAYNTYEALKKPVVKIISQQGTVYRWQALLEADKTGNVLPKELLEQALAKHLEAYNGSLEMNSYIQTAKFAVEVARDYALLGQLDEAQEFLAIANTNNTKIRSAQIYSLIDDILTDFKELRKR